MNDLVTLCLLGVFLIVGFMLLSRMMRGFGGSGYGERGPENPQYDDPDVRSRGGFGGMGGTRPNFDDPNVRSRGSFGRPRTGFFGGGSRSSGGRADSPNVRSRGGFGRSKNN